MMLEDSVQIAASADVVWSVTANIESWPDWTPTVEVAELLDSPLGMNSRARLKQPGMPAVIWQVTSFSEGRSFTWQTTVRGMRMIASHDIRPMESGVTNTLRLEALGWASVVFYPLIRPAIAKALAKENAGLKAACERSEDVAH